MSSAKIIARYFLSLQDKDAGDLMSNLKLQKLLYYAQGYHLALEGEPLFRDTIYAWKHGPVVRTVYDEYSGYKSRAIPVCERPTLSADKRKFLDEIYRVYGRFSAWALRDMTHREPPWLDNYEPDEMNVVIPNDDMKKFFKKNVKARTKE